MWNNAWGQSAPNSQVVQTDEEATNPFRARASYAADTAQGAPGVPHVMGRQLADAMGDWWGGAGNNMSAILYPQIMQGGGSFKTAIDNFMRETPGYTGPTLADVNNFDVKQTQADALADYGQATAGLTEIQNKRAEASQRQTQAYGQMQGGNYFGGMTNEGYSDPFSGQVGAGVGGTVGGLGGLGGMPTNPTQNANYNASWQPEQRQFRAGSWGSPFGSGS